MAAPPNTCGPYNNVSTPPFLLSEPSPPVTACIIYYNGNNTASTLLQQCCGANVPIATFNDGCLQYCNSSTAQEAAWGKCINGPKSGVYGYCITMGKKVNSGVSRSGGGVVGLGIAVLLTTGLFAGFA
ncbi:hypothetical protein BGZ57DRAFT_848007 [Hyaloscypha finlandica]|nr:hypothetical protein BGZ57DRAFT_848007 [Hyaloscypha finlandica]